MTERSKRHAPPEIPIAEGSVYVAGERHRRIIAIRAGRVFYSVGADHNRSCLVGTLRRWIRRRHAEVSRC